MAVPDRRHHTAGAAAEVGGRVGRWSDAAACGGPGAIRQAADRVPAKTALGGRLRPRVHPSANGAQSGALVLAAAAALAGHCSPLHQFAPRNAVGSIVRPGALTSTYPVIAPPTLTP